MADSPTKLEKYLPNKAGIKIDTNQKVDLLADEMIQFEWTDDNKPHRGQIVSFKEKYLAEMFFIQETSKLSNAIPFNEIQNGRCVQSNVTIQGQTISIFVCVKDRMVVFVMGVSNEGTLESMREILQKIDSLSEPSSESPDDFTDVSLDYLEIGKMFQLKQKEFESLFNTSVKNVEYYRNHPEEKPAIIKKANELFEDWKKARKESDEYHAWRKNREPILSEITKSRELFEIQNKKVTELNFFCMNHIMEETQDIQHQMLQIMSKTKGD